ncbi:MAG: 4-hydroxythreonine-4-phosphate dehydrogenase PdxA [Phycisphaerales bacterium]|nr:4-hydroxythreonine-4-phosphate dehydrogenase PdxA [Phycisphaerales bacterium]
MEAPKAGERPTFAITMGDPLGIGAEVIVKSLADRDLRRLAKFRIYGIESVLADAARAANIEPFWWRVEHDSPLVETAQAHDVVVLDWERRGGEFGFSRLPRAANKLAGELSLVFCDAAIAAAKREARDPLRADGIVTGPICKQAWSLAGFGRFPGHTELLGTRFAAKRVAMMFVSPRLNVVLATVHVPLMEIRDLFTIGTVFDAIDLGNDAIRRINGSGRRPKIAVCGLNPHAGENGILGDEEMRIIEPAIKVANDVGIDARGPFPGDTIFISAARGEWDLVVAMYHDQGLIPVKLLDRDRAVNVTLGLPTVRTSPDHGTAFDIAGKNKADPGSMRAAIELAVRMAGSLAPA